MPESTESQGGERGHGRALRGGAFAIVACVLALLGGAVGTFAFQLTRVELPQASTEVVTERSGPDVIVAVRDLARLETASFHVERVLELTSEQQHLYGLVQARDSILLVAAADVTAGVDLEALREGDVIVDRERGTARVLLPPPQVLATRIDSERTYVYARQTDLLASRREDLETEARRSAERTLRDHAIEAGILERAREQARSVIGSLIRSLGYDDVVIEFRDPPLTAGSE